LRKPKFILTVDSFVATKGSLTSIIGRMGSGKTSLLKAILGEMPCQIENGDAEPECTIRGKIAYCS
jgi:ATP-binding cassette subfamily C (CFTR/MRP) protein 1